MVWHIFRKDLRLLWRLAAGISLVHFVAVVGMFKQGHFGNPMTPGPVLLQLLRLAAFLGTGLLIVAAVHQDALPGARQDWLVRPVSRRDMLLAKLLFVLFVAEGPVFLADLVEALAGGFPLGQSLIAAVSRNAYVLLGFSLPILIFASLTRNFTEAVIGGLMAFAGYVAFQLISALLGEGTSLNFIVIGAPTGGLTWVAESIQLLLILLGGAAVLRFQYYRRKTLMARWLTVSLALLCLLTHFLPWQSAFALERSISPNPAAADGISVAFDPGMGKFRPPSGVTLETPGEPSAARSQGLTGVSLPLHLSGLPTDVVLKSDRSNVRVTSSGDNGDRIVKGADLEIRKEGPGDGEARIWQTILIPSSTYKRIEDTPIRLEIDYSLTLLTLAASHAIRALNGDQRMAGVGWCKTRMNDAETAVELSCLNVGDGPSCGTAFLEYAPGGRRNPAIFMCAADHTPFFRGSLTSDSLSRFAVPLPFRDAGGLTRYPVDGPKLAQSHVIARVYRPADHFTRRLVIPQIRLRDWQVE